MSGLSLRRLLAVLLAGAALVVPSTAGAKPAASAAQSGCLVLVIQQEHRAYATKVYKRAEISQAARRRLKTMRSCQHSREARQNTRQLEHKLKRKRNVWVLPRHVVMCESGGNPRSVNRSPAGRANHYPGGLYQIIRTTWARYGGTKYAPTAERATVFQQGIIALRVLKHEGRRAWECWSR